MLASSPLPFIPPSALRRVENLTRCEPFVAMKMAPGRRFFDTLVVKGSFHLAPGRLQWAESPSPIVIADQWSDPSSAERSSLAAAGEVLLHKPTTDVIVTGNARSPDATPRATWLAAVVVSHGDQTLARSTAEVTGPRTFQHRRLRGWTLSDPKPTEEVPIRYELAYGGAFLERGSEDGAVAWRTHPSNPSGTGFFDVEALDTSVEYAAPQWQLPEHPVTRIDREVPVAGLGPIARHWPSRLQYAGTYDRSWHERTYLEAAAGLAADYPADFDVRFFQAAHPSLICPHHLRGDETIGLGGLVAEHPRLSAQLPGIRIQASLRAWGHDWVDVRPPLDTVHVDLDDMKVHLCWRLTLDLHDEVLAAVLTEETL